MKGDTGFSPISRLAAVSGKPLWLFVPGIPVYCGSRAVSGLGKDRRPGVASGRSRGGGHDGIHVNLADSIRHTLSARQQGARLPRAMPGRSPRHRTVVRVYSW